MSKTAPCPSHTDKDFRSPWGRVAGKRFIDGSRGSTSIIGPYRTFQDLPMCSYGGVRAVADVISCIVPSPEAAMVSNPEAVKSTNSNAAISA